MNMFCRIMLASCVFILFFSPIAFQSRTAYAFFIFGFGNNGNQNATTDNNTGNPTLPDQDGAYDPNTGLPPADGAHTPPGSGSEGMLIRRMPAPEAETIPMNPDGTPAAKNEGSGRQAQTGRYQAPPPGPQPKNEGAPDVQFPVTGRVPSVNSEESEVARLLQPDGKPSLQEIAQQAGGGGPTNLRMGGSSGLGSDTGNDGEGSSKLDLPVSPDMRVPVPSPSPEGKNGVPTFPNELGRVAAGGGGSAQPTNLGVSNIAAVGQGYNGYSQQGFQGQGFGQPGAYELQPSQPTAPGTASGSSASPGGSGAGTLQPGGGNAGDCARALQAASQNGGQSLCSQLPTLIAPGVGICYGQDLSTLEQACRECLPQGPPQTAAPNPAGAAPSMAGSGPLPFESTPMPTP